MADPIDVQLWDELAAAEADTLLGFAGGEGRHRRRDAGQLRPRQKVFDADLLSLHHVSH
jgi:hypothetical protein